MADLKAHSRRWFEDGYSRNNATTLEELMPLQRLEESSWREHSPFNRADMHPAVSQD